MEAVLISGSPSTTSKSRTLLEHAQSVLAAAGCSTILLDLATFPAEALLGRRRNDPAITSAISAIGSSQIVVASSPTYRATYTGLLKTFFDLLPQDSLAGKVGVPILTGGGPAHQLALDHTFRPLFASLRATVVNGVYGHDAQFKSGVDTQLLESVDGAIEQAIVMARSIADLGLRIAD